MPTGVPEQRPAGELSDRALVDAVAGRSRTVASSEAIREVVRRRPAMLAELVTDRTLPAESRTVAALLLGQQRSPAHESALLDAVGDAEPRLLRRIAESLGKIGGEDALVALEAVRAPSGPVRRSVEFAKSLLSYRLGLDSHRLRRPPVTSELRVRPQRATSLKPARLQRGALASIMADVRHEVPGVSMSEKGALQFSCGESKFALLFSLELQQAETPQPLGRRNAVIGVILEKSPSVDNYYLIEYLFADPGPRGTVRLFGVAPLGVVIHVGELLLDAGGAFQVRAVDTRLSPPVAVEGSYDPPTGKVAITRMLVQDDLDPSQAAPREPTMDDA